MTKPELQKALDESLNFCKRVQEDYRGAGEEAGREGRGGSAAGSDVSQAYAKLKTGLDFYMPQIEEWKRERYSLKKRYEMGLEEHTKKLIEEFRRLKAGLRGVCEEGDREGSSECEGERAERGRNLQGVRARVAEGLRAGVAGRGIEAVKRAVHAIRQRLKEVPDELGRIGRGFSQWREEIWEKVTGKA